MDSLPRTPILHDLPMLTNMTSFSPAPYLRQDFPRSTSSIASGFFLQTRHLSPLFGLLCCCCSVCNHWR